MAKKFSQFPSAASISPGDSVVGLKDGANTRFSFATVFSYMQNLFVLTSRKVNNKPLTADITLDASDVGAVDTVDVGVADGVASLDSNGKVPGTQLDLSGKQSTITASGILKGDGQGGVSAATAGTDYQAPLTIDATPMANSTNPVQSGGVYTDVRTRVPNYGKGQNLLRNWYFVGGGTGRGVFPVNQPGKSSYSFYGQTTIDGWTGVGNNSAVGTPTANGFTINSPNSTNATWYQMLSPDLFYGKTVTFSVLTSEGFSTGTGIFPSSAPSSNVNVVEFSIKSGVAARFTAYSNLANGARAVVTTANASVTLKAMCLEIGTEQTLAHQENGAWVLNEIPDYEEELIKCQTSTADSSDTYANKSLATEQQLAYVETGTTASQNYTAGQYIALNGLLCTADTAIASGATFYTSGGNKNLTECVGGGFNSIPRIEQSHETTGITTASNCALGPGGYTRIGKILLLSLYVWVTSGSNSTALYLNLSDDIKPSSNAPISILAQNVSDDSTINVYAVASGSGIYMKGTTSRKGFALTGWWLTN